MANSPFSEVYKDRSQSQRISVIPIIVKTLLTASLLISKPVLGEVLGKLSMSRLILQPTMLVQQEQQGGFELGPSLMSWEWRNDDIFSAHFSVGTDQYRRAPLWSGEVSSENTGLNLVDGYARVDGGYLNVDLGLQRVPYGFASYYTEENWVVPEPFIFNSLWFPLTDFALSIRAAHRRYETVLTAFNGESELNSDGQAWIAGRWIYHGRSALVGVSGITADFVPLAITSETSIRVPTYLPDELSHLRILNSFVQTRYNTLEIVLEFHKGELLQQTQDQRFDAWSFFLNWKLAERWAMLMAIESFDPDQGRTDLAYRDSTLGFTYHSDFSSSKLGVLYKHKEELFETSEENDTLSVFFRYSPKAKN